MSETNLLIITTIITAIALVLWCFGDRLYENPYKFDPKKHWESKETKWKGKK